ncbi:MAG TPA: hypothetical protein VFH56_07600 [Acidimicrobiales bacterium]|nr:hypothetical protein [Acidimicrobiales bacterium]
MTGGAGEVTVTPEGDGRFRVDISGTSRTTSHTVRTTPATAGDLGWSGSVADLVGESFEFLLEREPQTSILREFDLEVITRYFPEYPGEIRRRSQDRQSS